MSTNSSSALILDSFPIVQKAMEKMLLSRHGFETVFIANNACSGSSVLKQNKIDLIILDIQLTDSDGFEFLRRIRAKQYSGKILFVSSNTHEMYSDTAKKLGANGYVSKTEAIEVIENAVSSIVLGFDVFRHDINNKFSALTKRETVVYNYLVKGFSNKRISELLAISNKTVSTYKSRILNKCNVDSIVELVQLKETN